MTRENLTQALNEDLAGECHAVLLYVTTRWEETARSSRGW